MFRALYLKELRACAPAGAAAFLALSWIAWTLSRDFSSPVLKALDAFDASGRSGWHSFEDDLWAWLALVCIGQGIVMALIQTVAESVQGTAPFLVQVGRNRHRILAAKIAAAMSVFAVATLPPLTAGLASVVGGTTPITPTSWWGLRYAWVIAGAGVASYLGLLAVGIRGFRLAFREEVRSMAGLALWVVGVSTALLVPWFGPAVTALVLVTVFAGAWSFSGFAEREF